MSTSQPKSPERLATELTFLSLKFREEAGFPGIKKEYISGLLEAAAEALKEKGQMQKPSI
ncbi:MAG: hypothetical protein V1721_05030 [Pseudomonadota bacterium]